MSISDHANTQAQPAPTRAVNSQSVTDAVVADMLARREHGRAKYNTELMSHNGRDALADAYQEVLDTAMYLKQALMERDGAPTGDVTVNIVVDGAAVNKAVLKDFKRRSDRGPRGPQEYGVL